MSYYKQKFRGMLDLLLSLALPLVSWDVILSLLSQKLHKVSLKLFFGGATYIVYKGYHWAIQIVIV